MNLAQEDLDFLTGPVQQTALPQEDLEFLTGPVSQDAPELLAEAPTPEVGIEDKAQERDWMGRFGQYFGHGIDDLQNTAVRELIDVVDIRDSPEGSFMRGVEDRLVENFFPNWVQEVQDWAVRDDAEREAELQALRPADAGFGEDVLRGTAESLPFMAASLLPGAGASIALRAKGASLTAQAWGGAVTANVVGGLISGTDKYYDSIDRGEPEVNARLDATINGITEAALGLPSALVAFTPGAPFLKTLAKAALWEIPTESLTSLFQDISDWVLINPELPAEEFWKSAAYNMAVAGTSAGLTSGAFGIAGKTTQIVGDKVVEATESYKKWGELYDRIQNKEQIEAQRLQTLQDIIKNFDTELQSVIAGEETEPTAAKILTVPRAEVEAWNQANPDPLQIKINYSGEKQEPISATLTANPQNTLFSGKVNTKDRTMVDIYLPEDYGKFPGPNPEDLRYKNLSDFQFRLQQAKIPFTLRDEIVPANKISPAFVPNQVPGAPKLRNNAMDVSISLDKPAIDFFKKMYGLGGKLKQVQGPFRTMVNAFKAHLDFAKSTPNFDAMVNRFADEVDTYSPDSGKPAPLMVFENPAINPAKTAEVKNLLEQLRKRMKIEQLPIALSFEQENSAGWYFGGLTQKDQSVAFINLSPSGMSNPRGWMETLIHEVGHALHNATEVELMKTGKFTKFPSLLRRMVKNSTRRFNTIDFLTEAKRMDTFSQANQKGRLGYYTSRGYETIAERRVGSFAESLTDADFDVNDPNSIANTFGSYAGAMKELYDFYKKLGHRPLESFDKFYSRFGMTEEQRRQARRLGILKKQKAQALQEWKNHSIFKRGVDRFNRVAAKVEQFDASNFGKAGAKAFKEIQAAIRRRRMRDIDSYNWFIEKFWGIHHLAMLNRHIAPLQAYLKSTMNAFAYKAQWQQEGVKLVRKWGEVNQTEEEIQLFNEFLWLADQESIREKRELTEVELDQIQIAVESLIGKQMNGLQRSLAKDFWKHYQDVLTEMNRLVTSSLDQELLDIQNGPLAGTAQGMQQELDIEAKLLQINEEFKNMMNRNWVPHTRFGNYFVDIQEPQANGKFRTVAFEGFETWGEAMEAAEDITQKSGGLYKATVSEKLIDDKANVVRGLPPVLQKYLLDKSAKEMKLSQQEKEELERVIKTIGYELAPERSGWKKFLKRKNTKGFSHSAVRTLSEYNVRMSGHMMRLNYIPEMAESTRAIREIVKDRKAQNPGGVVDVTKLNRIQGYMERHLDYILNPGNELAGLKAIGFIWYMGFSVKSAVVNLSQTPTVTYPYLAARYGDKEAISMMVNVMKEYKVYWEGKKKGAIGSIEEQTIWDSLVKMGIVDESYAAEMSSISEGSSIQRALPLSMLKQIMGGDRTTLLTQKAIDKATFMFAYMERRNREIAARSAIRLALKNGMSPADAREFAIETVMITQGEYASWSRGEMLRGKAGIFFLFKQYMLNMLFFLKQDPGSTRALLLMGLVAGYQGLPFAEDILDIFDFLGTEFKEWAGWNNPKVSSRVALRKMVTEFLDYEPVEHYLGGADTVSDFMAKGAGRYLGPWDISGSLGMGDVIPGTGMLNSEGKWSDALVDGAGEFAGAFVAIPMNFLLALNSDTPDAWRSWERAMPSVMAALSKTQRVDERGFDSNAGGYQQGTYDPKSVTDNIALFGQGLGFPRRSVTRAADEKYLADNVFNYYKKRRVALISKYYFYKETLGDSEKADEYFKDEIQTFNDTIPNRGFKIERRDLRQSARSRERTQDAVLDGVPTANPQLQDYYKTILDGES